MKRPEKKKVEKKQQDDEDPSKGEETQEEKGITVRHSIGITGVTEKVDAYLRTMLVDYATFHSPQDTMLYVAGANAARQSWRWAYALPH